MRGAFGRRMKEIVGQHMTADEYKQIRQSIGTQREVATILGVAPETVCRRERGTLEIPTEARLALLMARLTHGRPNALL